MDAKPFQDTVTWEAFKERKDEFANERANAQALFIRHIFEQLRAYFKEYLDAPVIVPSPFEDTDEVDMNFTEWLQDIEISGSMDTLAYVIPGLLEAVLELYSSVDEFEAELNAQLTGIYWHSDMQLQARAIVEAKTGDILISIS